MCGRARCAHVDHPTDVRERNGLALDRVMVEVKHARVHADDCDDCAARIDDRQIRGRRLRLEGALSDSERAALVDIADRCPAQRTLATASTIVTSLDMG